MTIWFAGGDVKPGVVGATDEIGQRAVEVVYSLRDVHVTILRLLGLDADRLRYFHHGRQMCEPIRRAGDQGAAGLK